MSKAEKYNVYARVNGDTLYKIGNNITIDFLHSHDFLTCYGYEVRLEGNIQDTSFKTCMDLFKSKLENISIEGKVEGEDTFLRYIVQGTKIYNYSISVYGDTYTISFKLIK